MTRHRGQLAGSGTLSMNGWVDGGSARTPIRHYITQDGKHLYSMNNSGAPTNGVTCFLRDLNTGALTEQAIGNIATGLAPTQIAEATDAGKHLYMSMGGSNYIKTYTRNVSTGLLTIVGSNAATGSTPFSCLISPDNLHVYTSNSGDATISQFSRNISTGALTPFATRDLALTASSQPRGLDMTKNPSSGISGKYVYVGHFGNNIITCLVRDTSTGVLSVNATYPAGVTGAEPTWLVVSPDDQHLYAVYDAAAKIGAFAINQSNGTLSLIAEYATGGGPWRVAITPDGSSVYVANSDSQSISQYTRNPATGALTPKTPAIIRSDPYYTQQTGSAGPNFVSVSPDGKHLYATNAFANYSIPTFNIHT